MTVLATGELHTDLNAIKTMIAASSSFQAFTGAADAAAAAEYVHFHYVLAPQSAFALLYLDPGHTIELVDLDGYQTTPVVIVQFVAVSSKADIGERLVDIENTAGAVVADLQAAQGTGINPFIASIQPDSGPGVLPRETAQHWVARSLKLTLSMRD